MDVDPVTGLGGDSFGIGTYDSGGRRFPGLVRPGGSVVDLSGRFRDTHEILDDWQRNFEILSELNAHLSGPTLQFSELRALPPLGHPNILGGGANYRRHVVEMLTHGPYSKRRRQEGESLEDAWQRNMAFVDNRARYGMPVLFACLHSALSGANDDIMLPPVGKNHDWEMELALVIGKGRRFATIEEAKSMIAGYMMFNDLATLDQFQRPDMPWQFDMFIKNQPTFKVAGPFIVPAQFVCRDELVIRLEVNGVEKQNWPVTDMIFSCEKMVVYASERTLLMPGDVILTGSPPGNASLTGDFLKDGDVVTGSVTGLGRQRNRCVAEQLREGARPVFGAFSTSMMVD
jgi:2,4-didehydro-3-deoxy-L-rhamnonate hydrolase